MPLRSDTHKHHSLRTKLIAFFAVLGLIPLTLMSVLALQIIGVTQRQSIATIEQQLIAQKGEEVNKLIASILELFEIRVSYEATSIIRDQDQKFLLEKLLEENKLITEASFVDLTGQETMKYSRVQDATLSGLLNVRNLPKFRITKTGERYIGDVYYTLAGPMVTVAAPVRNRNGAMIMVLAGEVALTPIQDLLATVRLGQQGFVYLIDRGGKIIASSKATYQHQQLSLTPWFQELLQGVVHTGLAHADRRIGVSQVPVFAAGLPLRHLAGGIVVEWPVDDALALVSSLRGQMALFSLIAILLVALFGIIIGRKILTPLAILREGAGKIGSGQFDHKITITTADELEELGEVFNAMGGDLQRLEELKAAKIRAQALAESLRKERVLSEEKSVFINTASHQFRTPISVINWFVERLLVAPPRTTVKKMQNVVTTIAENSKKLALIITDLFSITNLGIGYRSAYAATVDLATLLKKSIGMNAAAIEKKRIHVVTHLLDGVIIKGDEAPLGSALTNLIDNAITYTNDGGDIGITLAREKDAALITIVDNGIGIPANDQSQIFQQFFRASNAVSMKNVGTGLGLYIVKQVVEGHGGTVRFVSEEHKGTTFFVSLPLQ